LEVITFLVELYPDGIPNSLLPIHVVCSSITKGKLILRSLNCWYVLLQGVLQQRIKKGWAALEYAELSSASSLLSFCNVDGGVIIRCYRLGMEGGSVIKSDCTNDY